MSLIRAIAIDDEQDSLSILKILLNRYCPDIEVIGTTTSPLEGIKMINKEKPNLVFLDISMPGMDGFELLQNLKYRDFEVIFTTAHDEYAIKAFQVGAVHYLLKPIDRLEIIAAAERVTLKVQRNSMGDIDTLLQKIVSYRNPKIAIPTLKGIEMIDIDTIIHCEASSNYTVFYFEKSKKIITKTLKEIEQQLAPYNFMRIHHSHLINMAHLKNYVKVEGGFVTMSNGKQISVSRSKKNDLLQALNSE
jgi:two-component system LytT family response regulator